MKSSYSNSVDEGDSFGFRTIKPQRTPIYANIYDFSTCFNTVCGLCGLGVYHTGIEIL
jgi:hypothetical protein